MANLSDTSQLLSLLADPTRVRLVSLLHLEELSVAEITRITGLGQSRVSTHLGKLRDAGIVGDRKAGTSTFYRLNQAMPETARSVWTLIAKQLNDQTLRADHERCHALLKARAKDEAWPDSVAGEMERHYSPGRTWQATAKGFLGLLQLGDVLDAGSGDGTLAALIAPQSRSVTCIDHSEKLIAAAKERLSDQKNIQFKVGKLEKLPFGDPQFDAIMLFNVLTYSSEPTRVLQEAKRVLRPGGRLVGLTLRAHAQLSLTATYGHLVAGFETHQLEDMLHTAGFQIDQCEVTSRERRHPHFEVISFFAYSPRQNT